MCKEIGENIENPKMDGRFPIHADVTLSEAMDILEKIYEEFSEDCESDNTANSEASLRRPIEGHDGNWDGERGDSTWWPDRNAIPKNPKTNPEQKPWGEILDKYNIDGIPFKDGEPDFSEVSKGTVEIDDFSQNRYGKGGNFDQACEKLAEQKGCTKEEVKEWMKENKYTWHERSDCKTMDKVPTEVHGNICHEGGISEIKSNENREE